MIRKIVIAPNAFKNALTADAAAAAIARGWKKSRLLSAELALFPVADGGDGTASLLMAHLHADRITGDLRDPLGRTINAEFGVSQQTAIIEMANASGLRLLKKNELDPLQASSYGTGQQIMQAIAAGAKKILVAMGGSATVDGGIGILHALGLELLDEQGNTLPARIGSLAQTTSFNDQLLQQRLGTTEIIILCDVDNPLLGDRGAAAVFGPQKGATPDQVQQLDQLLGRFAELTATHTGKDMRQLKGAGTAGGAAAGLWAFAHAQLVDGIDYFLNITGFDQVLQNADLVITAEGSIDDQTLQGKAPFGVAKRAKEKGIPVIGLAGKIPTVVSAELNAWFDGLYAIGAGPVPLYQAIAQTAADLQRMGQSLGNSLGSLDR